MDKITAADLIAKKAETFPMPSAEALEELKKILIHNDANGNHLTRGHICADKVRELLLSWGYKCTRARLHLICQKIGRKDYLHA